MRVLGVVRLSRETDESTSPERQRETIGNWATLHGHEVIGWAEDLDVSGAVSPWERKGLGPWLKKRSSEFDIIVGSKVDRITRRLLHFVSLVDWCTELGKSVASATEPIDTGDRFGKMIAQILAMFAEFEHAAIRDRAEDSQRLARREGRYHGGTPPFGYMPKRDDKGYRLVVDPESSERVKEIVRRILSGDSMNSVCIDFNSSGVLTPSDYYRKTVGKPTTGRRWHTSTIQPILRGRAILGIAEKNGEVVRGEDGLPVHRAEAIISREDWNRLQIILDKAAIKKPRTSKTSPLLGIIFCLGCGKPMYRAVTGSAGKKTRPVYYRCKGRWNHLNDCQAPAVSAGLLEDVISDLLLETIGDFITTKKVVIPAESHRAELDEATASLDDLLKLSRGKSDVVKKIYAKQIASLEAMIDRLSALPETKERVEFVSTGKTYRQLWNQSDETERRRLLLEAGIRVEAMRGEGLKIPIQATASDPDRDDQIVQITNRDDLIVIMKIPRDIARRSLGKDQDLGYREASLFG